MSLVVSLAKIVVTLSASISRRKIMRFGFDLDEVVVDLTPEFESYLAANYGIDWPAECFINFEFEKCGFVNDEELNNKIVKDMVEIANDADFQFNADPVEGAREVLQKFKRIGHKLYFISSRPKRNQPKTFKWLRQNDIPFDKLIIVGRNDPKGPYGLKFKLDMYVDDLEKHLESMWIYKKRWRKGLILLDRPWNSAYYDGSRFIKLKNWQDILRHVGIQNR